MTSQMIVACIAVCAFTAVSASAQCVDADVLLRGGLIFDGAGGEGVVGDVAIAGEKIAAVGRFEVGKVGRVVDCTGLMIAPGFIDLHSHTDDSIEEKGRCPNVNFLRQGCTSVLTGNCGGGALDAAAYYAKIDREGCGTNVLHLLPHGALRKDVMGLDKRAPTPEELEQMKQRVARAMCEGAWGLSTGLVYVPGAYATTEEVAALAEVVAAHGGLYASHVRNEGDRVLEAIGEAIEIGRRAGVAVQISHLKCNGKNNWGRMDEVLALIEEARGEGLVVHADQYPYTAGCTDLQSFLIDAGNIPGGVKDLLERMESDVDLERLVRQNIQASVDRSNQIVIAASKEFPQYVGKGLREIAAEEGLETVDLALKILRKENPTSVNHYMSEDDVRLAMTKPWVATASDGEAHELNPAESPHPRFYGTFPRKIGFYAMREKVVPLAQAVRSCTGLPADILKLDDRGYLRPGWIADVVVFDPKEFIDRATFENPQQYATGVRHLYIAGHAAIDDGVVSETLYGRAVRHRATQGPSRGR